MDSQSKFENIINTSQTAFIQTADGIVLESNEYGKEHIGIEIGNHIRKYYSDPSQYDIIFNRDLQTEPSFNAIVEYRMVDGGSRHFLSNFTVVQHDSKKAYIQWAIDIENNQVDIDPVSITQKSLQAVLDSLPMPVRIIDLESAKITYVNNSLLELLNYDSATEVCGLYLSEILPEYTSDGTDALEIVNMMMRAEHPISLRIEYLTKTGGIVEAMEATQLIEYKGMHSSIGIIKDLTTEKERAQVLLKAMQREKEANQAKSLFLANMSHEIRTPMNGIIGMTDLLLGERLSDRQLQYAKDIKISAESLLGVINDILDFSKIGGGKLQIIPADIELTTMLKNVVSMLSFTARSKGLDFIDEIQLKSPEYVRVDDVRLKQIIVNLLSNAIKFTKTGHVRFAAKIEDEKLKFEVSDTGIGIKKEDMPLIFTAFEQVDNHKNRAIKGTGLGLSITKNLIELMNGEILVESEYEHGTTFFVAIPYIEGDESAVEIADMDFEYIFAPTAQVLLVDDIQTNLTVGAGLLRMCGITADVAMSGYEAIEIVKVKDYDIIFMDHMMPELDGIETMRIIRDMGAKYVDLPIIALTANAVNEARDLMINSGMNDFLSKPMDKAALMAVLKKWLPASKIDIGSNPVETVRAEVYSEALLMVSKIEGMDIELALSRIGGMHEVLEESIKQVSFSMEGQLKKMDSFLSIEDCRGFAIIAHGLKGALANIGAMTFSELAAELEIAAKAENIQMCIKKFPVFYDVMIQFSDELKSTFKRSDTGNKPQGDNEFLIGKIDESINFLQAFEAGDALDLLKELTCFTFGENTDVMLSDVNNLIRIYKYDEAIALLLKLNTELRIIW